MTGGAIVSYLLIAKKTGEVAEAGFPQRSTDLTSLRGAHAAKSKRGNCTKRAEPTTSWKESGGLLLPGVPRAAGIPFCCPVGSDRALAL